MRAYSHLPLLTHSSQATSGSRTLATLSTLEDEKRIVCALTVSQSFHLPAPDPAFNHTALIATTSMLPDIDLSAGLPTVPSTRSKGKLTLCVKCDRFDGKSLQSGGIMKRCGKKFVGQ